MTEPTTSDKLDEILKKAWEHGYYSNNYPSDPNMTWFSDDKQELTKLIQTLEKKARIDELNKLSVDRETNDRIDVDFVDWQSIENRLSELGERGTAPNNTTTRSKE